PDLRAYVAWALADKTKIEPLWNDRSSLGPYALALVGLALQQTGDARAGEVAAMLERAAVVDEREAHWKAERDDLMDVYIDASPEVTAWAIKFLARQNPKSPLLPKAALYLVTHRDQGPYWASTKQTAMVIHGLTDYLKQSGELKPDLGFSVTVNDREVLSRRFSQSDALSPAPVVIALDGSKLGGGAEQRVRIRMNGQGRLYWSTRSSYYSASRKLAPQGNVSLAVSREYFRLVPSRESEKIVYRLEPFSGAAQTGDVLAAKLRLDGRDWRYLMIEDPIPAGAELIERDDLYELSPKPDWWRSWFTRRELRDDRAAIFQTFVERGPREYFYLMKITNAGRFRVSPARVQPMYQPQ
ncbi:MAG: MG2 domain-containing protein, partial [Candidatus Rokuibacteriota bacterium]